MLPKAKLSQLELAAFPPDIVAPFFTEITVVVEAATTNRPQ